MYHQKVTLKNHLFESSLNYFRKDLFLFYISFNVTYEPDEEKLRDLYLHFGESYAEIILPPVGYEILKNELVRF